VQQALKVIPELGLQVQRVLVEIRDLLGTQEQELQALQGPRDLWGIPVLLVIPAPKEIPVFRELRVLLEILGPREPPEQWEVVLIHPFRWMAPWPLLATSLLTSVQEQELLMPFIFIVRLQVPLDLLL